MKPTRSATLHSVFVGDGEYDLCLKIKQLIELQEKLDVGPHVLATRIMSGSWMVEDIIETLRLALIGGGMNPSTAYRIVSQYVCEAYFLDYVPVAGECLFAAIMGVPDEPLEDEAGEESDPLKPHPSTDSSDGANYMSQVEPLDSHPSK